MRNLVQRRSILLCFIIYFFMTISLGYIVYGAGSSTALEKGRALYGNAQKCVCREKFSNARPNKTAAGDISGLIIDYTLNESESNDTTCVYDYNDNGSQQKLNIGCGTANVNGYMKKYIDAGIFKDETDAQAFYNDAEFYALYVSQGLTTKTSNLFGTTDLGDAKLQKAMFDFNNNAHYIYSFLIGFAFITAMFVFITIFLKITWLPDHPIKRREAMEDIVTSGISVLLTGGIWIFISLFQSIFDRFWSSYAVYSKDWKTVANMFLFEYKGIVIGFLGIATMTALLMLIKNFVGLSFTGDNPSARKQKMISILYCGIGIAGMGGLGIFLGFFWNALY